LFLDAMLLVVGGMTRLLELLLPTRTSFYEYIELVDIWTALALLCMFAGYTLIVVARSLYQGIRSQ